jgi:hypothetical protein
VFERYRTRPKGSPGRRARRALANALQALTAWNVTPSFKQLARALLQKGPVAAPLLGMLAAKTVAKGLAQRVQAAQATPEDRAGQHATQTLADTLWQLAAWSATPSCR